MISITIRNIQTGEEKTYNKYSSVAKDLRLTYYQIRQIIDKKNMNDPECCMYEITHLDKDAPIEDKDQAYHHKYWLNVFKPRLAAKKAAETINSSTESLITD